MPNATLNDSYSNAAPPAADAMRTLAWELGEERAADQYLPPESHCALQFVNPRQAFVHYRILTSWIDSVASDKGSAWHHCRMILRMYDVTDVEFNGFNAHAIINIQVQHVAGHAFINLPRSGRVWMVEAGFELRSREFISAARSQYFSAPVEGPSGRTDHAALYVGDDFRVEEAGNLWDQAAFLEDKRRPRLREKLTIVHLALEAAATGGAGVSASFVTELAAEQAGEGHAVRVFVPANEDFQAEFNIGGVTYSPLAATAEGAPLDIARDFGVSAEAAMSGVSCDLLHCHDWMSAQHGLLSKYSSVLSFASLEVSRLNGAEPGELSKAIAACEKTAAAAAGLILTPDWLRAQAEVQLGLPGERIHAFPLEGRVASEWDEPIDAGKVRAEIGFGPLDRVLLYIGPLEYTAGVDLLIDAMPTVLHRAGNTRLAIIGTGIQFDELSGKAWHLGVAHAVKLLGDVRGDAVARYLRACEALVLPSRGRVQFDDSTVHLARRAGKPVVTTHAGPAYCVKHEENGVITYDNPNSMVWALDRILGDPAHAERMGLQGKQDGGVRTISWPEIVRRYFTLCLARFPALRRAAENGVGAAK
jgi:glycosyltransferase involved in cell wall biosynthesis